MEVQSNTSTGENNVGPMKLREICNTLFYLANTVDLATIILPGWVTVSETKI